MKRVNLFLFLFFSTSVMAQYDGVQLFVEDILHEIRINSDHPDFFEEMITNFEVNLPGGYTYFSASVSITNRK